MDRGQINAAWEEGIEAQTNRLGFERAMKMQEEASAFCTSQDPKYFDDLWRNKYLPENLSAPTLDAHLVGTARRVVDGVGLNIPVHAYRNSFHADYIDFATYALPKCNAGIQLSQAITDKAWVALIDWFTKGSSTPTKALREAYQQANSKEAKQYWKTAAATGGARTFSHGSGEDD
ncbi:hypothetical protein MMC18_005437 [Xylographa bjoerkii]|nr:hypothetical protein [Xylographa bjoerkii]